MKSKILPILFALIFHFANGKCNLPKSTLLFSINSFHTSRLGVINTTQNILTVQIVNVSGNIYLNEEVKGGTNLFKLLDLRNLPSFI